MITFNIVRQTVLSYDDFSLFMYDTKESVSLAERSAKYIFTHIFFVYQKKF